MKKIFLMSATMVALIIASCSKDGGENDTTNENFSVILGFKNSATTRTDGPAAVAETKVQIESGYLCFVNTGDVITDVYSISEAATSGKNISKDDLSATAVTIPNVPGSSAKVYLVANKKTLAATPVVGADMATFLNNAMDVRDQSDYTTVTCVDDDVLTPIPDTDKKSANIELATDVSRIQIKGLSFEDFTSGKVAGIFINGFYTAMELDGEASDLKTSYDKLHYAAGADGSIFTNELQSYVYDTFDKNIATSVTPDVAGNVWGYNLFASATPQIIIKLTDVVAGEQTYTAPQFITVNGFSENGSPITTLAGGMIYTIEAGTLVIKPEHLTPDPGTTPFTVEVTVEQAEWDETVVTPNL